MVQGPCQENQVAVAESKFFDIANDLFNEITQKKKKHPSEKKKKKKKKVDSSIIEGNVDSQLSPWMVQRLQNKCLNLILSLMEKRDIKDNPLIRRIIRNLPINVIIKVLILRF